MINEIISISIAVFGWAKDIFAGGIEKRSYLKKDLQYGNEQLQNLIIDYQYMGWDTNIRTKKLDVLQKLHEGIERYGIKELKESDVFAKIQLAIDNINSITNVDDIIEIKAKLSYFITKL